MFQCCSISSSGPYLPDLSYSLFYFVPQGISKPSLHLPSTAATNSLNWTTMIVCNNPQVNNLPFCFSSQDTFNFDHFDDYCYIIPISYIILPVLFSPKKKIFSEHQIIHTTVTSIKRACHIFSIKYSTFLFGRGKNVLTLSMWGLIGCCNIIHLKFLFFTKKDLLRTSNYSIHQTCMSHFLHQILKSVNRTTLYIYENTLIDWSPWSYYICVNYQNIQIVKNLWNILIGCISRHCTLSGKDTQGNN